MSSIPEEHKKKSPPYVNFFLFVISTSLNEAKEDYSLTSPLKADKTTPLVKTMIERDKHRLIGVSVIPDQKLAIQTQFHKTIEQYHPDILITSGGTGISPQDLTPDAITPLLDRVLPGFSVIFHQQSILDIGPASMMMSRAMAGTYKNTIVFVLPGSPNAVKLALEKIILPEAGHLLAILKSTGATKHE